MKTAPQTMTDAGLAFLSGLAAEAGNGVLLEVGPLFGSSTNAIDRGRRDASVPIHTIDTFEAAPWVRERVGIDLSREMFDKFTSHIKNLHVHQGYAPDVVTETWSEKIGFYFDDATHGNPGWLNNYNFFSKFFTDDAIICGDDFAGGWPDIIRNVYGLAEEYDARLFVIGRVWALARKKEDRILKVIDGLYPKLAGVVTHTLHGDLKTSMASSSWSWGLHRKAPMTGLGIKGAGKIKGTLVTSTLGNVVDSVPLDGTMAKMEGVDQVLITTSPKVKLQFCTVNGRGKTSNSKAIWSGNAFDVPKNESVVAIRLTN